MVASVMALLDHALPLLRAKGILAVVLLCRRGAGRGGGGRRGVLVAGWRLVLVPGVPG